MASLLRSLKPSTITRSFASKTYSTMPGKSAAFLDAAKARRSIYQLTDKSTLSDEQLQKLVEDAVMHAPTSFNMQQSRAVLVTGDMHQKVWDTVFECFTKSFDDDKGVAEYKKKVDSTYRPGYGTVLFFESHKVLEEWGQKMPNYKKEFFTWSENSAGILQYIVWTALSEEGIGASLQHFGGMNQEVNKGLLKLLELPEDYQSSAIMPFGVPAAPAGEKQFSPIEERVKVFTGSK